MRLIDADAMKNNVIGKVLEDLIDAQPTAYDVGKVVKELEAYKAKHRGSDGHYISIINNAIEIVASSKNDD